MLGKNRHSPDILATFHGKNVDKTFFVVFPDPTDQERAQSAYIIHTCLQHCLLSLSPPQRPLYVARRWGERKRKRAGHDGKGKEREERPLPIVPHALSVFQLVSFFIGISSWSLCVGESY